MSYLTNKKTKTVFRTDKKSSDAHHGSVRPETGIKFVPATKETKYQTNERKDIEENMRVKLVQNVEIKPELFLEATNSDKNWVPPYGVQSVKNIKKRLEDGKPIDKPFLVIDPSPKPNQYENQKDADVPQIVAHEGRHRSFVAKKLGVEKIPIDVYCIKHGLFGCTCKIDEKTIEDANPQLPSDKEIDQQRERQKKIWKGEATSWKKDDAESEKNRKKIEAVFS